MNGKYEARNRFKVSFHARTERVGGDVDGVATYPATKGLNSTRIAALGDSLRLIFAELRGNRTEVGDVAALTLDGLVEELLSYADRLRPMVADTALVLNQALDAGQTETDAFGDLLKDLERQGLIKVEGRELVLQPGFERAHSGRFAA
mgnify:CR=1 FL=1